MDREQSLHLSVCNAVQVMNMSPDIARSEDGRKARDILRQALIDYADSYMDQPVSESERESVAKKHRRAK